MSNYRVRHIYSLQPSDVAPYKCLTEPTTLLTLDLQLLDASTLLEKGLSNDSLELNGLSYSSSHANALFYWFDTATGTQLEENNKRFSLSQMDRQHSSSLNVRFSAFYFYSNEVPCLQPETACDPERRRILGQIKLQNGIVHFQLSEPTK